MIKTILLIYLSLGILQLLVYLAEKNDKYGKN
jgi:hypothetical protein